MWWFLEDLQEDIHFGFLCIYSENGQLKSSVYMCYKASDLLDEVCKKKWHNDTVRTMIILFSPRIWFSLYTQVAQHYPQLHMEGARNVWIIKPGASSRGRGTDTQCRQDCVIFLFQPKTDINKHS